MKQENYLEALGNLNPEQRLAVETIDGPVAVAAGPGTGKTQMLTLRIAHIIATVGADVSENILALTFTNSAVRSMRERLASFTGHEAAHAVSLFTFHSFAQHTISSFPEYFGQFGNRRIASEVEKLELLQTIIDSDIPFGHLKPMYDPYFYLRDVSFGMGKIKGEGYTPDEYRKVIAERHILDQQDESLYYKRDSKFGKKGEIKKGELLKLQKKHDKNQMLADIYESYQSKLETAGLFDYEDLLLVLQQELAANDEFRAQMQEQYQYILVDEHQDTNSGQNNIIELLITNPVWEGKPNIFTVGDAKQSIFRFAGATSSSFEQLRELVPATSEVTLATNYRSGQHILDQAHTLISEGADHATEVNLDAHIDATGVMEMRSFSSYTYELFFIAGQIKKSLESGVDPNEIAVLYRKNAYAEDIRSVFDGFGIPYKDYSKKNLLDNPEMKKLFLFFQAINNLNNDQVFAQLLYVDFLDIHPYSVSKILEKFRNTRRTDKKHIYAIISSEDILKELALPQKDIEACVMLASVIAELQTKSHNEDFITFFSDAIRMTGFLDHTLSLNDSVGAVSVLEKLFDEVKKESFTKPEYQLTDFISYLQTLKKYNLSIEIPSGHTEGVSLLTFHGSKGLEFEDVYLYKAIETRKMPNKLPLYIDSFSESTEDERRLLYVAMTRAKQNIYISYPRFDYQDRERSLISFLRDQAGIAEVATESFEKDYKAPAEVLFAESKPVRLSLLDPDYITKRFLKKPMSVSALNNYLQSPLLYFFRNLVLLPEAMNDSLEFGNLIHAVLEDYFIDAQKTQVCGSKKDLLAHLATRIEQSDAWEKYMQKAEKILENYFDEYVDSFVVPDEIEYGVFGVEFELEGREESLLLSGRIDKIEKRDGETVVVDYKTGKTYSEKGTKQAKEGLVRQAVFYALLLENYRSGIYATRIVEFDFIELN